MKQSRRSLLFHALVWAALEPLVPDARRSSTAVQLGKARRWLLRLASVVWGCAPVAAGTPDEAVDVIENSVLPEVLLRCKRMLLTLPGHADNASGPATLHNLTRLALGLVGKVARLGDLTSRIFERPAGDLSFLLEGGTRLLRDDARWYGLATEDGECILEGLFSLPEALPLPLRFENPPMAQHPQAARILAPGRAMAPWDRTRVLRLVAGPSGVVPGCADRGRGESADRPSHHIQENGQPPIQRQSASHTVTSEQSPIDGQSAAGLAPDPVGGAAGIIQIVTCDLTTRDGSGTHGAVRPASNGG
jgi:hypothetical protein